MSTDSFFYIEFALLALILPPTLVALFGAPWVPTPKKCVRKMLELAKTKPGDTVFDIGCGDGRMIHIASNEFGANATGLELSPLIYVMAKIRLFFLFSKAKVIFGDCRAHSLSKVDIIVCYLLPAFLNRLKSKFEKELPSGSRFVSYAFKIDGWTPIHVEPRNKMMGHAPIYVYEMPFSKNLNQSPTRSCEQSYECKENTNQ